MATGPYGNYDFGIKANPAGTPTGNQSWFGMGAPTAFNMNGTSNTQPVGSTQFQMKANPTASSVFTPYQAPQQQGGVTQGGQSYINPMNGKVMSGQQQSYQFSPGQGPEQSLGLGNNGQQSSNNPFSNIGSMIQYMGNTAMPTMDQIQQDPGYQFRQQQGLAALDNSLAGRHMLGSSGYSKDVLDYSQGLASQEYQNAYDRYKGNQQMKLNDFQNAYGMANTDRQFGANRYDTGFNQNMQQNQQDTANNHWDVTNGQNQNQQGIDNWFKQMSGAQSSDSGLAGTGLGSAKDMTDLITNSASAFTNLGLSQANIESLKQIAASGNQANLMKSIIQMITTGGGMIYGGPGGAVAGNTAGKLITGPDQTTMNPYA